MSAHPEDDEIDSKPVDLQTIEPINPIKLLGYFNDVIKSLLEDPKADLLGSSQESDSTGNSSAIQASNASVLQLCTTFASDSSPSVIFILRDSSQTEEELDKDSENRKF